MSAIVAAIDALSFTPPEDFQSDLFDYGLMDGIPVPGLLKITSVEENVDYAILQRPDQKYPHLLYQGQGPTLINLEIIKSETVELVAFLALRNFVYTNKKGPVSIIHPTVNALGILDVVITRIRTKGPDEVGFWITELECVQFKNDSLDPITGAEWDSGLGLFDNFDIPSPL